MLNKNKVLFLSLLIIGSIISIWIYTKRRSRDNFLTSWKICNNLTIEKYCISFGGGAHTSDLYSQYLIDKDNNRIFVGTHDGNSFIEYECKIDKVIATKIEIDTKQINKVWEVKY